MARAIVTALRGSGKVVPGGTDLIATVYFSGDDVSADVEGQPYYVPVRLAADYTLGELKTAMGAAVGDQAAALGLSVNSSAIDLPSFEHGPP